MSIELTRDDLSPTLKKLHALPDHLRNSSALRNHLAALHHLGGNRSTKDALPQYGSYTERLRELQTKAAIQAEADRFMGH